jgi:hypothetical protein
MIASGGLSMRRLIYLATLVMLVLSVAGCRTDLGNLFDIY